MSFRKLLSAILVASLVFGLVGTTAFADTQEDMYKSAAGLLVKFKIVQGDPDRGLAPERDITRAEMIKIVVAAAGKGEDAKLLAGAPAFSDTQKHWVSGYAALAKNMGVTVGYPDGTFKPEAKVTYAEVVTFLARLVGLQPAAAAWPMSYIQAAVDAGVIPAEIDVAKYADAPAIRGAVFVLADNAFRKVPVDGKNLYQRVFDPAPPTLTVDAVTSPTEATKVTVAGTVSADAVALFINGQAATFDADGAFSADVDLELGANSIVITALDIVGNEAATKVPVERLNAPAATITAPASVTVKAGETADVAVVVEDKNGVEIADATVTPTYSVDDLGTYADGKFTAGTKAQSGSLVLTAGAAVANVTVNVEPADLAKIEVTAAKATASIGEAVKFTAKGYDAHGNQVTGITPAFTVDVTDGSAIVNPASGDFIASKANNYTVTATVGDISASATVGVYASTVDKLVVSAPANVVANSIISTSNTKGTKAEVKVTLVDANGNVISNNSTYQVKLALPAGAAFIDGNATKAVTNGVATFDVYVTYNAAGQILTLTATDANTTPVLTKDYTTTMEALPQVASGVTVTTSDDYLRANGVGTVDITTKVVDQAGVTMRNGAWQLAYSITGPGTLDKTSTYFSSINGTVPNPDPSKVIVTGQTGVVGDIVVTANVANIGTATATIKSAIATDSKSLTLAASKTDVVAANMQFIGNTADQKTAGSADFTILTIKTVDANGVPVARGAANYTLELGIDSTVTTGGIANNHAVKVYPVNAAGDAPDYAASPLTATANTTSSKYTVAIGATSTSTKVAIVADKFTGAIPVTVKDPATTNALVSASTTLSFGAHKAAEVGFTRTTVTVSAANPKYTLTAQLYDVAGNKVALAGSEIAFVANETSTTISATKATTDAAGAATVEVAVQPYVGSAGTVTLSSSTLGTMTGKGTATLRIDNTVASSVTTTLLYGAASNGTGGTQVASVTAGQVLTVKVVVKDAYGVQLGKSLGIDGSGAGLTTSGGVLADAFTLLNLEITAGDADQITAWTRNGLGTAADPYYYWTTLRVIEAGAFTVKVTEANSPADVAGSATVGVWPSTTPTSIAIPQATDVSGVNHIAVTKNQLSGPFTLNLTDAFGNTVIPTTPTSVVFDYNNLGVVSNYVVMQSSTTGGAIAKGAPIEFAAGQSSFTFYLLTNTDGITMSLTFNGIHTFVLDAN